MARHDPMLAGPMGPTLRRAAAGALSLAAAGAALAIALPIPRGSAQEADGRQPAARPAGEDGRSPFAWRGVVEGAYGRPWDRGQRMRVLRFMAAHGLNAYVHAPKEDLYQRARWREPYPRHQQAEFAREVAYARDRGVEWVPNLSPGLPALPTPGVPPEARSRDVCFSCTGEIDVLIRKLEPFWAAGARTFMVSFDDVEKRLTHAADRRAFGAGPAAYGRANGSLLGRLLEALRARDRSARLLTVGADYYGTDDTAYLRGLREWLPRAVEVMWTGPGIFSENFRPEEARAYARAIGRKPAVWDNWTVNDIDGNVRARPRRIYLGPYRRLPDIAREVSGFFLNPMNEADLNLLPFATAADYFADPGRFDARRSFLRVAAELGGDEADALRAFAEVNHSTRLDRRDEAPTFVRRSRGFLAAYGRGGAWPGPRDALERELQLVESAGRRLARVRALGPFVAQARAFLASGAKGARAGRTAAGLLAAERPRLALAPASEAQASGELAGRVTPADPAAAARLRFRLLSHERAMRSDPHDTYGHRAGAVDVPPVKPPPNVMDVFVDRVQAIDSGWRTRSSRARSLTLRVEGRRVAVRRDGSFRLPVADCGRMLEAVDGSGGRTAVRLPSCERSAPRFGASVSASA